MKGLAGDDTIIGYGPLDRLEGGLGNDIINAAGGTVLGGAGNDVITAEITADIVVRDGAGSDEIFIRPQASQQIRMIADVSGGTGNDVYVVDGGPGAVISYQASTQGIQLRLENGAFGAEVGADRLTGFTIAIGGSGDDLMLSTETGGELRGGAGDDELRGFAGDDKLIGGDGNDRIIDIEGGKVNVVAGNGDDTVDVSGSGGRIYLGDGTNVLTFNNEFVAPTGEFIVALSGIDNSIVCTDANEVLRIIGEGIAAIDLGENGTIKAQYEFGTYNGSLSSTNETLILKNHTGFLVDLNSSQYSGIDRVFTGSGEQFLTGSATAYNAFESGSGDDHIVTRADVTDVNAGSGNDEIHCYGHLTNVTAGAGDDLVHGGTGTALIDFGNGLNRVFGGEGAETVNFDTDTSDIAGRALDYVFNFSQGTDKIRLEADADISAFLATGYETLISNIEGVRFDTVSGDMLFIKDVTLAQLSIGDFLI